MQVVSVTLAPVPTEQVTVYGSNEVDKIFCRCLE
jgi:hypothetical protein